MRKETVLESSHVDFARELRMSQAFMYFQDIAAAHAGSLGAGVEKLLRGYDSAWILMRMRAEVDRMPRLDERVVIETWPRATAPLYERDYVIRSAGGETLIRAASIWIIMNLTTREIMKDKIVDYDGIEIDNTRAIEGKLRQMKAPNGLEPVSEKRIEYGDVDYNGHANNVKYVDYCYDTFSLDWLKGRRLRAIEVNYINEVHYGDTVRLFRAQTPDSAPEAPVYYIEGRGMDGAGSPPDGTHTVFKTRMEFTARQE
jgi:acyl-ACP thioesterase